ncbi:thioredoxin-like domain-containing protein [Chryseobacterium sp. SIMBA_038]|uniref:thioredoxin-like domain-containing protein n=1 Tax=Chryseobacterium sp. SIMBA_038 TaxID=3085780 RepID=UPI003979BDD3
MKFPKQNILFLFIIIPFFCVQAQQPIAIPNITLTKGISAAEETIALQQAQTNNKTIAEELDRNSDSDKIKDISEIFSTNLAADTDNKKAKKIVRYIANDIDWQKLYASGHSSEVITLWVDIYTKLKNSNAFITDFEIIGDKIKDPLQYTNFVEKIAYNFTQKNKEYYTYMISDLVRASGKVRHYDGILAVYLKGAQGTKAPDLIINEKDKTTKVLKTGELANKKYTKTILLFYLSGCGPCEALLPKLSEKYTEINNKGIKIISISGDKDEKTFKDKAKNLPWKDSIYCDYKGFEGINFQNYAIAGTPTIFLLDQDGKIVLRTSYLEEILGYINNSN